eukprot:9581020-Alexandrium_andersonii.AAC.1
MPARQRRTHSASWRPRAWAGPHPWSRVQAIAPAAAAASARPRGAPRSPKTGPRDVKAMGGAQPC